ncbi:MAG: hypothetical protein IT381_13925 [Deltaproteobacteria bacterium]|nr:hypothetical protein [Deltaproteobacteria bacterium]
MGLACLLAVLGTTCTPLSVGQRLVMKAPDRPTIVIVKSSQLEALDIPFTAFTSQVDASVWSFVVTPEQDDEALADEISALQPALIVALGATATTLAFERFPNTPTLVALVVNYRRLQLAQRPNVMVIALEPPAAAEFIQFQLVLPTLRRVLAFYAPHESAELVKSAKVQLAAMDIELVAIPVSSIDDVPDAYQANKKGKDAVWFLNDSVIMNPKTFAYLRTHTLQDRLPFIASLSEDFAVNGALMSVSVDLRSLAGQALIMEKLLVEQGKKPSEIGVQPPIGAKLVVNTDVAKAIGLELPDDIQPFIRKARTHTARGAGKD